MNVLSTPFIRGGSAIEHSLTGLSRSKDQFNQAAIETINSFSEQANILSGGAGDTALSSASFVSAISTDPAIGMVNMISAQRAFEANLKVFSVAEELESSVVDMLT